MSKITKFAKGQPCTVRLPQCNGNHETTVWMHINSIRWGAGRGKKAPDICGAIACSNCHDVADGRMKTNMDSDFIRMAIYEAHFESLMLLHKAGII